MYKDKDKQREANRQAKARQRAESQRVANNTMCKRLKEGMTNEGMTAVSEQTHVIPCDTPKVIPKGVTFRPACVTCKDMVGEDGIAACDVGGCDKPLRESDKPKRGKDIKCFADLPPDVQQTIYIMSLVDGKIDKTVKANRTAIAIAYQQTFGGDIQYL